MKDQRHGQLAHLLVNYSVALKPGESCLIQAVDVPVEMVEALVEAVYNAGGYPQVRLLSERLHRVMLAQASEESLQRQADAEGYQMERMDAFIGIRGHQNPLETALISDNRHALYMKRFNHPVHHLIRIPKTKWVVLRYPTPTMAYQAGLPTEDFESFYYAVTAEVDYGRMSRAMDSACAYIDQADQVRIIGPGTNLSFSIKGMGSVKCDGHRNIPDGEIYTAPVRDSVEGKITYNVPSTYQGYTYRDITFVFRQGKIVEAGANNTGRINALLDTDRGSRYIGEFALGVNPGIINPMDETLFDEKIMGSFHFTPGAAYASCDNGNESAIHWDLVSIQRPETGGGEIWMDGELIRKDGLFVHEAFLGLNPERLTEENIT